MANPNPQDVSYNLLLNYGFGQKLIYINKKYSNVTPITGVEPVINSDLSGLTIIGPFSGTQCNFYNTTFSQDVTPGITFTECIFTNATMANKSIHLNTDTCDLTNVNFTNSVVYGINNGTISSNFTNANLTNSTIPYFNISGCVLTNAKFIGSKFNEAGSNTSTINKCDFTGVDFSGSLLNNVQFKNCTLHNTDFRNATLLNNCLFQNVSGTPLLPPNYKLVTANVNFSPFILGPNIQSTIDNADLSGAILTNIDLSGYSFKNDNLFNSNFSNSNLTNVNFSGSTMSYINLSGCTITGTNFTNVITLNNSILNGLNFSNIKNKNLSPLNISNSDLSKANLTGCNLSGCNLSYSNLTNATINNTNLTNCNLSGSLIVDLSNSPFKNSEQYLIGTQFTGAKLSGIDFSGLNIPLLDLTKCDISGGNFNNSIILNMILTQAIINKSNFFQAQLENSDLEGTTITDTILRSTNLSGSTLENSTILNSNLTFTKMPNVNIKGAFINNSEMTNCDLSTTQTNSNTKLEFIKISNIDSGNFRPPPGYVTIIIEAITETTKIYNIIDNKGNSIITQSSTNVFGSSFTNSLVLTDLSSNNIPLLRDNIKHIIDIFTKLNYNIENIQVKDIQTTLDTNTNNKLLTLLNDTFNGKSAILAITVSMTSL